MTSKGRKLKVKRPPIPERQGLIELNLKIKKIILPKEMTIHQIFEDSKHTLQVDETRYVSIRDTSLTKALIHCLLFRP